MNARIAVLGGGCFWCLEAVFQRLKGILEVTSGYAGGDHPAPTYREVCSGTTGHAEVVRISFDPDVISFRTLLEVFFAIHDPTTRDRQGADVGPQYRSIILHTDAEQQRIAAELMQELEEEGRWPAPIVTELTPLQAFHPAEVEHRDYYIRNSNQRYCMAVVAPKVAHARDAFTDLFLDRPTP